MSWKYRNKKTSSGKTIRSKKIERLDNIFSRFIRRRDCGYKVGICISCGALITFETCDCGHYINRQHMSLRYDEQNCNAQCRDCNRNDEGNVQGYRRGLIIKIGEKATDMLEIKKHNICKMTEAELDILYAHYSEKLKKIEQNCIFLP